MGSKNWLFWLPSSIQVTLISRGLNPLDEQLAMAVASLFSITGPTDITDGVDGGARQNGISQ